MSNKVNVKYKFYYSFQLANSIFLKMKNEKWKFSGPNNTPPNLAYTSIPTWLVSYVNPISQK